MPLGRLLLIGLILMLAACHPAAGSALPDAHLTPIPAALASVLPLPSSASTTAVSPAPTAPSPATSSLAELFPENNVDVQPLQVAPGHPPLWVVSSRFGALPISNPIGSFVAIYSRTITGWLELDRVGVGAPLIGDVKQVQVEPSHLWLEVYSPAGPGSLIYYLLKFDGATLDIAFEHGSGPISDGGGISFEDFDGDGIAEVVFLSGHCVRSGPHICDILLQTVRILRWDGAHMAPFSLTPLPDSAPENLRQSMSRAIVLAQGGLWKDAYETVDQAIGQLPQEPLVRLNAALIRLQAERRARYIASYTTEKYPFQYLAYHLDYGDYDAIVRQMRAYPPGELFSHSSPVLADDAGSIDKNYDPFDLIMSSWFTKTTSLAVQAQPDLAAAYFLRGWATYLATPGDSQALADITRAAKLDPNEPLFTQSLAYLQKSER